MNGEPGPSGRQGESGPAGRQGESGGTGLAGRAGERGEKGEAGGQGLVGSRGQIGPRGKPTATATILFLTVCVLLTFTLWQGEHDSCMRANGVRAVIADKYALDSIRAAKIATGEVGVERTVNVAFASYYQQLAKATMPLDCSQAAPPTGNFNTAKLRAIVVSARAVQP